MTEYKPQTPNPNIKPHQPETFLVFKAELGAETGVGGAPVEVDRSEKGRGDLVMITTSPKGKCGCGTGTSRSVEGGYHDIELRAGKRSDRRFI